MFSVKSGDWSKKSFIICLFCKRQFEKTVTEICFPNSLDVTEQLLQLQTDTSLFVASAANQMLAHILVFFQSVSSAGCNGVDKKDDGRNHSSIHSDVVVAVSEYLKRSLVPEDNTKLHQSVQTLKLLALLLAQVGPPLHDTLFQTAADSLEKLVTAGYSQLTVPLMDVIMAAHRYTGSVT